MDILEKLGIDPYKFLEVDHSSSKEDIKKAYKKKAKILHPDKTQGTTEKEFKILHLCYKYCTSNCVVVTTSDFKELKNTGDRNEIKTYSREFHRTNFEDDKIREEIYADNDINFEEFKEQVKKMQSMSTTYSPENFYKKEILDSLKTNGSFDKDKFNAYFLKLKKDKKIGNQLEKVDKLKAFNEDDDYMYINIYNNMAVTIDKNKNNGNYKKLMNEKELNQSDFDSVLKTDIKTINNIIKESKKDTGKISRKKMSNMVKNESLKISLEKEEEVSDKFNAKDIKREKKLLKKTNLQFKDLSKRIDLENIERIRREKEEQRKYVEKNKKIFQNYILF